MPFRRFSVFTAILFLSLWLSATIRSQTPPASQPTSRPSTQPTTQPTQAQVSRARADIANLFTALSALEIDMGRYPTAEEGLAALRQPPPTAQGWQGPYVLRLPKDPWGNAYIYRIPGRRNPNSLDLLSPGPDGKADTKDDIGNWE